MTTADASTIAGSGLVATAMGAAKRAALDAGNAAKRAVKG